MADKSAATYHPYNTLEEAQRAETFQRIQAFVDALTPAVANETHAWNLWNLLASDRGAMRTALEWAWRTYDTPDDKEPQ